MTIPDLDSQSSFRMVTVSYKTKSFLTLYTNFLNDSSAKAMELAMEIQLCNLPFYISTYKEEKWPPSPSAKTKLAIITIKQQWQASTSD